MRDCEIYVVVMLFVGDGGLEALRDFETKAMEVLRSYSAELLSAFRPIPTESDGPDEIHLLKFPSQEAFESFKQDPRHAELAAERSKAISKTILYVSDQLVQYPNY